jgi:hypothetical protein
VDALSIVPLTINSAQFGMDIQQGLVDFAFSGILNGTHSL